MIGLNLRYDDAIGFAQQQLTDISMILLCQKQCYTGYFNAKKLGEKPNIIVNCYDFGNSIPQQFLFFEGWATGLPMAEKIKFVKAVANLININ